MNDRFQKAFDKILAEEKLKNCTKEILAQKIRENQTHRSFSVRRLAGAMACLAVLLLGGGGYFVYFIPTAAISVDVNPSMELAVNRFDRIISVEGYNTDGDALAKSLDIKFLNYTDALEKILTDESMYVYMSQDEIVAITVTGADEKRNEEILEKVESSTAKQKNVYCYAGNSEKVALAHEAGLSFGKYRAFLELQILDPDVTTEEVQGLTMRQIRERIEQLSGAQNEILQDSSKCCGENTEKKFGYRHGKGEGKWKDLSGN